MGRRKLEPHEKSQNSHGSALDAEASAKRNKTVNAVEALGKAVAKRVRSSRVSQRDLKDITTDIARKVLLESAGPAFRDIVLAQVEAARGMFVEKTVQVRDKDGNVIDEKRQVYQERPDIKVGEYLINQIAGKPKESVDIRKTITLIIDDGD